MALHTAASTIRRDRGLTPRSSDEQRGRALPHAVVHCLFAVQDFVCLNFSFFVCLGLRILGLGCMGLGLGVQS